MAYDFLIFHFLTFDHLTYNALACTACKQVPKNEKAPDDSQACVDRWVCPGRKAPACCALSPRALFFRRRPGRALPTRAAFFFLSGMRWLLATRRQRHVCSVARVSSVARAQHAGQRQNAGGALLATGMAHLSTCRAPHATRKHRARADAVTHLYLSLRAPGGH